MYTVFVVIIIDMLKIKTNIHVVSIQVCWVFCTNLRCNGGKYRININWISNNVIDMKNLYSNDAKLRTPNY